MTINIPAFFHELINNQKFLIITKRSLIDEIIIIYVGSNQTSLKEAVREITRFLFGVTIEFINKDYFCN